MKMNRICDGWYHYPGVKVSLNHYHCPHDITTNTLMMKTPNLHSLKQEMNTTQLERKLKTVFGTSNCTGTEEWFLSNRCDDYSQTKSKFVTTCLTWKSATYYKLMKSNYEQYIANIISCLINRIDFIRLWNNFKVMLMISHHSLVMIKCLKLIGPSQ